MSGMTLEQWRDQLTKAITCGERPSRGEMEDLRDAISAHLAKLEGKAIVPKQMQLDADTFRVIEFTCGGDRDSEDESEQIGEIEQDDGSKLYGLHLYCDDYPEEGSVTLAEFPA